MSAVSEAGRLGSMVVFFLIALVIVGPFGFVRIRRILRERQPPASPAPSEATPGSGIEGTSDAATLVAAIDRAAAELSRTGADERVVVVPGDATVDGRPAPPTIVDALLADAARRSGLTLTWLPGAGAGPRRARLVRCEREAPDGW